MPRLSGGVFLVFTYQKCKYVKSSITVRSPNGTFSIVTRTKFRDEGVSPEHHEKADHRKARGDTVNRNSSSISKVVQHFTQEGRSAITLHADNEVDYSSGDM